MSSSNRTAADEDEDFKTSPTKVLRSFQHNEPEHFLLKVESFSVLSKSKIEKYESEEFEADGYKWRLTLYPKGDKKRNGENHLSLYLSISDTKTLPQGWEVKAHYTFFVYNNITDKYLTFQVSNASARSARRFHGLKTEWGFAQLLALDYFKEASNGYLFDDTCVFGAEVSVISASVVAKRQCLSMVKETNNKVFSWKIHSFSTLKDEPLHSNKFKIGELQWKLLLYPKGNGDGKGTHISLYLEVADDELKTLLPPDWKVYAEYKLKIRNHVNNSNHVEMQDNYWFSNSIQNWGYSDFIPLSDVKNKLMGFLVNDTLLVEVDITVVAAITKDIT